MSFFKNSFRKGESFVPTPTQEIPGIQPIAVQAIENLFPSMDDQKYVFNYVLKLGEWSRTYRQPKWLLAVLYYSNGKKENLIDLNSPLLADPRFVVDEFEPVFSTVKDAEEWVKLLTNWRSDVSSGRIKNDSSWVLQDALQTINQHFGFMLEQGYRIYSAKEYPNADKPSWEVILRKQGLLVRIYVERRVVEEISFRTNTQPLDEFAEIRTVVYALTEGKVVPNFVGGTKGFANLLQKHLNTIEARFGDFVKKAGSIQTAHKEFYKAISSPQEVISPKKEEKIIPILYYPLMGMIFLLLFGAVVTLYMVLMDRLFAAISPDPAFYGIFMGVALLLAIGTMTMFIIWRRRKTG